MEALKQRIRHVPDFPKPGILFYDVTTLLKDREGFQLAVDAMAAPHLSQAIDLVVGIESRGFIFGSAMADRLKAGFRAGAEARQAAVEDAAGLLRARVRQRTRSRFTRTPRRRGQRVLIVDDLLATGGTAAATVGLVRGLGADVVGVQFLIELAGLDGREKLPGENGRTRCCEY